MKKEQDFDGMLAGLARFLAETLMGLDGVSPYRSRVSLS
jgi:hypothetical protein